MSTVLALSMLSIVACVLCACCVLICFESAAAKLIIDQLWNAGFALLFFMIAYAAMDYLLGFFFGLVTTALIITASVFYVAGLRDRAVAQVKIDEEIRKILKSGHDGS